jgi:hypothetical protein
MQKSQKLGMFFGDRKWEFLEENKFFNSKKYKNQSYEFFRLRLFLIQINKNHLENNRHILKINKNLSIKTTFTRNPKTSKTSKNHIFNFQTNRKLPFQKPSKITIIKSQKLTSLKTLFQINHQKLPLAKPRNAPNFLIWPTDQKDAKFPHFPTKFL